MSRIVIALLGCLLVSLPALAVDNPHSEIVYRASLGRADDVKLLLKQGVSPDEKNDSGVPLLALAADRKDNQSLPVITILLDSGAHIEGTDADGQTALFYAVKQGNMNAVKYLLSRGANYYAADKNGSTARNIAYSSGHKEIGEFIDNFIKGLSDKRAGEYQKYTETLERNLKETEAQTAEAQMAQAQAAKAQAAEAQAQAAKVQAAEAETQAAKTQTAEAQAQAAKAQTAATEAQAQAQAAKIEAVTAKAEAAEAEAAKAKAEMQAQAAKAEALAANKPIEQPAAAKQDAPSVSKPIHQPALKQEVPITHGEAPPVPPVSTPEELQMMAAAQKKRQEEIKSLNSDLAFNNCAFQYWSFCSDVNQRTEMTAEALDTAIDSYRDKITAIQDQLEKDYRVGHKAVLKISTVAKQRIFDELNTMPPSKAYRHEEGVGKEDDMKTRCQSAARRWDIDLPPPPPPPKQSTPIGKYR